MVTQTHVFFLDAEAEQEVLAGVLPVLEPFQIGARLAEEFQLHLLKLTGTEGEVARGNLVTEGLTNLCHAKRNLAAGGALYILEVYEDTLCGLRTQVQLVLCVLSDTLEGLEHQVKLTNIGKVMTTAVRAGDLLFVDVIAHLLIAPASRIFAGSVLDQLVSAVTGMTVLAVHQRVREAADMAGSNPSHRVHQDSGIQTDIVRGLLYELLSPSVLDVILEFDTKRTVIPGVSKTAVDLGAAVNEAAALAQGNDLVHCLFGVVHNFYSL